MLIETLQEDKRDYKEETIETIELKIINNTMTTEVGTKEETNSTKETTEMTTIIDVLYINAFAYFNCSTIRTIRQRHL